ncbi:hypothetical protein [Citrobacter sp. S-77]|uniref:hypothetical protein n=1 Tax=Citrobacter sp. S-77 TaxID=1080067 RepID=UPI0005EE1060|nr:hypothetical protein [Citrobacter sp. S-77]
MKATKNAELRRAILSIPYNISEVPESITMQDVVKQWPLLSESGCSPIAILTMANSNDESVLSDYWMREFMRVLNWNNGYHTS